MEIYERIAELASEKGLSKKVLVARILALEPHLRSTGEIPSESALYNYLNGNREIKLELVPYIAQALGVFEQELFICSERDKTRFYHHLAARYALFDPEFAELLPYASPRLIAHIKSLLRESRDEVKAAIEKSNEEIKQK